MAEENKWSPGYVTATLTDALADTLRMKAQAKLAEAEVMPQPMPAPVPSKSKNFAYTNIRLATQAPGTADTEAMEDPGRPLLPRLTTKKNGLVLAGWGCWAP